jgi:hypothetical protein
VLLPPGPLVTTVGVLFPDSLRPPGLKFTTDPPELPGPLTMTVPPELPGPSITVVLPPELPGPLVTVVLLPPGPLVTIVGVLFPESLRPPDLPGLRGKDTKYQGAGYQC